MGTIPGAAGSYPEQYLFVYGLVGLHLDFNFSVVNVGLDGAFIWNGGEVINAGLSKLGYQDSYGTLGMAPGARVEIPVKIHVTERMDVIVCPYALYFGIGKGDSFNIEDANGNVVGSAMEPASTTYLYGGRVGVGFHF